MKLRFILPTLLAMISVAATDAHAIVYQWSAVVEKAISNETKDHPRAFLWIPEHCRKVRAVVIGNQNMEEQQLFENDTFRKTLSDLDFGLIWITPAMNGINFRVDHNDPEILTATLDALAAASGYGEIATVPLVPVGHSATASWGFDMAAWQPQRVLAILSLSGQWPYVGGDFRAGQSIDDVPALTTKGEYEINGSLETGWYAGLKGDYFTAHPNNCFTQVVEPGGGHFEASAEKIALINLYLRKAAQYRLPAGTPDSGATQLRPMNGGRDGWFFEIWRSGSQPNFAAAPVNAYKGKRDTAFWAFDGEMARAIEAFQKPRYPGRQPVLIGYQQAAGLAPPITDHAMVHLKFEPIGDGLTFRLSGGFWNKVPSTPDGKKTAWEDWLNIGGGQLKQGDALPTAKTEADHLSIDRICGPVARMKGDTFAIRFDRVGFGSPRRSGDIWLILNYPGSNRFKKMVQQAELQIPLPNKQGTPQTITFPQVSDVPSAASAGEVQLKAFSSSGAEVRYYVREGPAEIDERGVLTLKPIPPSSRFPIKVTVMAWQWGRSIEPRMQSAKPMEQAFSILAP